MMTPNRQYADTTREYITRAEVVELWRDIEQHRAAIDHALATFKHWLDGSPALAEEWNKFITAGGVTAHDLARHLDGQVIRYRTTRQRRHLRLIVNQRRKPTVIRRPRRHGDDAA